MFKFLCLFALALGCLFMIWRSFKNKPSTEELALEAAEDRNLLANQRVTVLDATSDAIEAETVLAKKAAKVEKAEKKLKPDPVLDDDDDGDKTP